MTQMCLTAGSRSIRNPPVYNDHAVRENTGDSLLAVQKSIAFGNDKLRGAGCKDSQTFCVLVLIEDPSDAEKQGTDRCVG